VGEGDRETVREKIGCPIHIESFAGADGGYDLLLLGGVIRRRKAHPVAIPASGKRKENDDMALLVQGSTGPKVRNLQTALNYHMPNVPPPLAVDGIFGPKTRARLMQFQTRFQLKVDGVVGPQTGGALYTFVDCSHHLITEKRPAGNRSIRRGIGDSPSQPPFRLPQLPRLELTFPVKLPPVPSILFPPRLEIDPRLLLLARITKFELEAGKQTSFKKDLSNPTDPERETAVFGDLKGTVWSRPFGKFVKVSAGGGMVVEHRIKPTPQTEASVYVFGKVEVADFLTLKPIDIAKLSAEAQIKGTPGGKEPPDMSVAVSAGPEVEVVKDKLTFGPGAYLEYKTNGKEHTLTPGVKFSGTFHF
jgi:hypothetical protein